MLDISCSLPLFLLGCLLLQGSTSKHRSSSRPLFPFIPLFFPSNTMLTSRRCFLPSALPSRTKSIVLRESDAPHHRSFFVSFSSLTVLHTLPPRFSKLTKPLLLLPFLLLLPLPSHKLQSSPSSFSLHTPLACSSPCSRSQNPRLRPTFQAGPFETWSTSSSCSSPCLPPSFARRRPLNPPSKTSSPPISSY